MTKHFIEFKNIEGFNREIEIAESYGMGASKSLIAQVTFSTKDILFKVIDHGNTIIIEQDLEKAIEVYNEI